MGTPPWLWRRLRRLPSTFIAGCVPAGDSQTQPESKVRDRLAARYRGKRYSFGYPACPELADQRLLFELLEPEDIGVELTEGDMMSPEASVSAMVFHHPDARYFGV